MARRLLPGGLRAQLTIAIALVAVLGVVLSFVALYSGTGSRLRAQIDSNLRTQVAEWTQYSAHADISTPSALEHAAEGFLEDQRYHASSSIYLVQINGGEPVTNESGVIRGEEERERHGADERGLLNAPLGLAQRVGGRGRQHARADASGRRRAADRSGRSASRRR